LVKASALAEQKIRAFVGNKMPFSSRHYWIRQRRKNEKINTSLENK